MERESDLGCSNETLGHATVDAEYVLKPLLFELLGLKFLIG